MNDSFANQNSVAYYQTPSPQPTVTDSDAGVVVDAPAVAQSSSSGILPQDPQHQAQQPGMAQYTSTQPQNQPSSVDKPEDVSVNSQVSVNATVVSTPTTTVEPVQTPPSPPPSMQSQEPQVVSSVAMPQGTSSAVTDKTDVTSKSSPEEVVRRLAERIKSYQARQANAATPHDVPPTPAGNVVVSPVADTVEKTEPQQTQTSASVTPTPSADTNSSAVPSTTTSQPEMAQSESEALDAQNIFELLGVMDGSEQEKDAFLDQLQQVIWEDFLENDVQLLLTKAEATELESLLAQENQSETDRQEAAVLFLEKLIPDLESIMLEKALELKREMVFERIAGMRELHGGKPEILARITEAEVLFKQDKWLTGARILNSIK